MTKDEALKLALEALDCIRSPLYVREITKVGNAMKAIKEALAQEQEPPVANGIIRTLVSIDKDGIETWKHEPFYTTPPQPKPEQEPVAWRSWNDKDKFGFWDTKAEAESWCDLDFDSEPLYTTPPPQRTWVGLTDEEISEIEDEYIVDYRIPAGSAWNFARDIEAKLKEKNG